MPNLLGKVVHHREGGRNLFLGNPVYVDTDNDAKVAGKRIYQPLGKTLCQVKILMDMVVMAINFNFLLFFSLQS